MTARTQTRRLGTGSETVGTAWPGLLCRMAVSPLWTMTWNMGEAHSTTGHSWLLATRGTGGRKFCWAGTSCSLLSTPTAPGPWPRLAEASLSCWVRAGAWLTPGPGGIVISWVRLKTPFPRVFTVSLGNLGFGDIHLESAGCWAGLWPGWRLGRSPVLPLERRTHGALGLGLCGQLGGSGKSQEMASVNLTSTCFSRDVGLWGRLQLGEVLPRTTSLL